MPTEEYQWIIMDSYETLKALENYQSCVGKTYNFGDKTFKCIRVVAGPRDRHVFSKKWEKYMKDSRSEVFSGVDKEYTLYFFNSKAKKPKKFLRLDQFVEYCLNGKPLE